MYKIVDNFDINKLEENGFTKEKHLWKMNVVTLSERPKYYMDLVVDGCTKILRLKSGFSTYDEFCFYKQKVKEEIIKELIEKGIVEEIKDNRDFPNFLVNNGMFCKCEECGHKRAMVDCSEALTSMPVKYRYVCPECGYIGYVVCAYATSETDTVDKE